jgi:hypothetical protein
MTMTNEEVKAAAKSDAKSMVLEFKIAKLELKASELEIESADDKFMLAIERGTDIKAARAEYKAAIDKHEANKAKFNAIEAKLRPAFRAALEIIMAKEVDN